MHGRLRFRCVMTAAVCCPLGSRWSSLPHTKYPCLEFNVDVCTTCPSGTVGEGSAGNVSFGMQRPKSQDRGLAKLLVDTDYVPAVVCRIGKVVIYEWGEHSFPLNVLVLVEYLASAVATCFAECHACRPASVLVIERAMVMDVFTRENDWHTTAVVFVGDDSIPIPEIGCIKSTGRSVSPSRVPASAGVSSL